MTSYILELRDVTKVYDNGVIANHGVNFNLKEREIHALVGENGAGKSTLMKILFGSEQPTKGEIFLKGKSCKIDNPNKAIEMGIGMVHQHFMLVPSFTVTQNLILGMEPKKGLKIDYAKAREEVLHLANKYNFNLDVDEKVDNISVGMKQKVEILKALLRGAQILILDEPTAVLTPQETDELFDQLKILKDAGHTIIFISHKLKEVKDLCDRVSVIRKGETKGVFDIASVSEQDISQLMVGRDVVLKYDKSQQEPGEALLDVKNLSVFKGDKAILEKVSFKLKRGKILGIAGVEGNGQLPLIESLTGYIKDYQGQVQYKNRELSSFSIKELRENKLSYIPEDRMTKGIAGEASIADNLISNIYDHSPLLNKGLLNSTVIKEHSEKQITDYEVLCKNQSQSIESLSGGNIQKVVVARECSIGPDVLIAEQPTRGVDIGSAQTIHKEFLKLRDNQTAILLMSADLNEVMELSDSLIVLFEGEIVAYIEDPSKIDEKELGLYMLGLKKQSPEQIGRAYDK